MSHIEVTGRLTLALQAIGDFKENGKARKNLVWLLDIN